MTELRDAAMTSKAWPFEEARRLLKRYASTPPEKGYVLFETGYGPVACRISAPSARSRAPPWCAAPSR
jgi:hypothetical protein